MTSRMPLFCASATIPLRAIFYLVDQLLVIAFYEYYPKPLLMILIVPNLCKLGLSYRYLV